MALVKSVAGNKSRKIFLIFFILSSLVPIFFMIYMTYEYLLPQAGTRDLDEIKQAIIFGLLVMLPLPLVSFLLMNRWIASLEVVTDEIRSRSAEVADGRVAFSARGIDVEKRVPKEMLVREANSSRDNEIRVLVDSFNAVFQTASDQIAERQRLRELLAKLIAIASDLTSELDFDRLLPLIVGEVTAVMGAERTSLYVIDWERDEIWTKVAEGIPPIRLPFGKGISGRVAQTGETINAPDAWELPYFDRTFDEKNDFRTRSVLCVPIKGRLGERIGVLQVINKLDRKQYFDLEDEVFMSALSSQVGIALENSLLVEEVRLSFTSFVVTMSAIVDARHPYTAGHSERVTEYSLLIASDMKRLSIDREALRYAALLHDIGKIGVRDAVLLKNGPYTQEEREEMNKHPVMTRSILEKLRFPRALSRVPVIACYHHEKMNGQGYPDGLKGEQIPLESRIIAVADVFDALTSKRDYPKYDEDSLLTSDPLPLEKVVSILKDGAGVQFDPVVVESFLRCLPRALLMYRGAHFDPGYVDSFLQTREQADVRVTMH
ncbi:MAG TPA: HD domain-containing phosphohydrolase [Syntrophales bacterium]|nr:HD domain-containing phosphohydrolase [Syntrophales bacterium]